MGIQGDNLSWDRQKLSAQSDNVVFGDAEVLWDWLCCDPQMLPVLTGLIAPNDTWTQINSSCVVLAQFLP